MTSRCGRASLGSIRTLPLSAGSNIRLLTGLQPVPPTFQRNQQFFFPLLFPSDFLSRYLFHFDSGYRYVFTCAAEAQT
jgi:hypothetical protein